MVSTVTVTTITTIAGMGFAASLSVFCIVLLIGFLTTRELFNSSNDVRKKLFARSLIVGIIPLLVAFVAIIGIKVTEILA